MNLKTPTVTRTMQPIAEAYTLKGKLKPRVFNNLPKSSTDGEERIKHLNSLCYKRKSWQYTFIKICQQ